MLKLDTQNNTVTIPTELRSWAIYTSALGNKVEKPGDIKAVGNKDVTWLQQNNNYNIPASGFIVTAHRSAKGNLSCYVYKIVDKKLFAHMGHCGWVPAFAGQYPTSHNWDGVCKTLNAEGGFVATACDL